MLRRDLLPVTLTLIIGKVVTRLGRPMLAARLELEANLYA